MQFVVTIPTAESYVGFRRANHRAHALITDWREAIGLGWTPRRFQKLKKATFMLYLCFLDTQRFGSKSLGAVVPEVKPLQWVQLVKSFWAEGCRTFGGEAFPGAGDLRCFKIDLILGFVQHHLQKCETQKATGQALPACHGGQYRHPSETIRRGVFSRMRSEGSRFTWGSGGEAVFAKFCVCGRNRRQVFATVRNRPQPLA